MWLTSLLPTRLWGSERHGHGPCRRPALQRRAARPRLEALEGRALLSSWTVTSTADDGTSGTLRWAITQANADTDPAGAIVQFDSKVFSTPQTISLSSTLELTNIVVPEKIDATNVSPVTISGNKAVRVLQVDSSVTATLAGLTISDGSYDYGGAGILNLQGGTLIVTRCTLSRNQADGGIYKASSGGGIYNQGTLIVSGTTLSGNSATYDGGGIFSSGTLTVSNSTLSGNSVSEFGGGICMYNGNGSSAKGTVSNSTLSGNSAFNGGGVYNDGVLTVSDSTLSGNLQDPNGLGGGIYNFQDGTLTLNNTIVAGNFVAGSNYIALPSEISSLPTGSFSGKSNLIGDPASAGGLTNGSDGNIVGDGSGHPIDITTVFATTGGPANPVPLLADNGGPTQTIALIAKSPAIDKGNNALVAVDPSTGLPLTTDQRGNGFPRIVNGTVDIGAFEFQGTNPLASPTLSTSPSASTVTLGTTAPTLKDTATLASGYNETGTITFTLYYNGGSSPVDTETVTVSGNGTYTTPTGYTLPTSGTVTGTYQWDASYSGDSNNNPVSDNNNANEQVTVSPASPSLSTTPGGTVVIGTNLITNGSFENAVAGEDPGSSFRTLGAGSTAIPGWTVGGGGVDYVGTLWQASDGNRSVDMNASTPGGPGGTISQVLTTTPGAMYEVLFDLAGNPVDLPTIKHLQVSVDNAASTTQVYTFDITGHSETAMGWQRDNVFDFTASSVSTTLTFASQDVGQYGPVLDNVRAYAATPKLTDSATLAGGYNETGAITFTLYYNGGSSPVDTETVTVSGNGTYTTPTGYTLPTSGTVTGTYQWDASYSGDSNNNPVSDNNNANEQVTVSPASTSTTVTSSPPSPSVYGQTVTFLATVKNTTSGSGIVPTGSVQFLIDGTPYGSPVPLDFNGQAGITDTALLQAHLPVSGSPHTVTVDYLNSDGDFQDSSGSLSQTVTPASTSTTVTSSPPSPSVYGQTVTFLATVKNTTSGSGVVPTGSVQFLIDGTPYGSPVPLDFNGQAGITDTALLQAHLPVSGSPHTVTVDYLNSDGDFQDSSGSLSQTVTPASTSTTVTSSPPSPSVYGQTVTFLATVSNTTSGSGIVPTGSVQFIIDGSKYGSPVKLDFNGQAGITDTALHVSGSPHTVTVNYLNSDGDFQDSNGSLTGGQTVTPASTSTAVSSSPDPSVYGQAVTFLATVSNTTSGSGIVPTGSVQFIIDGSKYGSPVKLDFNGQAGITDTALHVSGSPHTVTVNYLNSDGDFQDSTGSLTGGQTVTLASTSTAVSSSLDPSVYGQSVSFKATVAPVRRGPARRPVRSRSTTARPRWARARSVAARRRTRPRSSRPARTRSRRSTTATALSPPARRQP